MSKLYTFSLAVAAAIGADRVLAQFGIEDTGDEELMARVQAVLSLQHEAGEIIESLTALYDGAATKALQRQLNELVRRDTDGPSLEARGAALALLATQARAMYPPLSAAVQALRSARSSLANATVLPPAFLDDLERTLDMESLKLGQAETEGDLRSCEEQLYHLVEVNQNAVEAAEAATAKIEVATAELDALEEVAPGGVYAHFVDRYRTLIRNSNEVATQRDLAVLSTTLDEFSQELSSATDRCRRTIQTLAETRTRIEEFDREMPASLGQTLLAKMATIEGDSAGGTDFDDLDDTEIDCEYLIEEAEELRAALDPLEAAISEMVDAVERTDASNLIAEAVKQGYAMRQQAILAQIEQLTSSLEISACQETCLALCAEIDALLTQVGRLEAVDPQLAAREAERRVRIGAELTSLQQAIETQTASADALRARLREVSDFKDSLRLREQLEVVGARVGQYQDRSNQLERYIETSEVHCVRAERGAAQVAELREMLNELQEPEDFAQWARLNRDLIPENIARPSPEEYEAGQRPDQLHVSDMDDVQLERHIAELNANPQVVTRVGEEIAALRNRVDDHARRPAVDAKLYFDESEVMMISAEQRDVLQGLLDRALSCLPEQPVEAEALMRFTTQQFDVFAQGREFELPRITASPGQVLKAVQLDAERTRLMIDNLRAQGAQVPRKYERRMSRIEEKISRVDASNQEKLIEIAGKIAALNEGLEGVVVPELDDDDLQAVESASVARDQTAVRLKSIYKFDPDRPLDPQEMAGLHRSEYLQVGSGSDAEYFKIKLTEKAFVNGIPVEALAALRQQMEMVDLMVSTSTQGTAELVSQAVQDLQATESAVLDGGETYKTIKKQLKKADKVLRKSPLKGWQVDGLAETREALRKLETSWASSSDPAATLAEVNVVVGQLEALASDAERLKASHESVARELSDARVRLANERNEGVSGSIAALLVGQRDIVYSSEVQAREQDPDPGREAEIETAIQRIEDAITVLDGLTDKTDKAVGLQKSAENMLDAAERALDSQSSSGVQSAQVSIEAALEELEEFKTNLEAQSSDDVYKLVTSLADSLSRQAEAAQAHEMAIADAERFMAECEEEFVTVNRLLEMFEEHRLRGQLKTIYDGLHSQFESAIMSYKSKQDHAAAAATFLRMRTELRTLAEDLRRLPSEATASDPINLRELQSKLRQAAATAKTGAMDVLNHLNSGKYDPDQIDDHLARQAAIATNANAEIVKSRMKPLSEDGFWAQLQFSDAVVEDVERAGTPDDRKQVREAVLAELRRMSDRVSEHPSAKLYRGNAFDRGARWDTLRRALLDTENQVLQKLKP